MTQPSPQSVVVVREYLTKLGQRLIYWSQTADTAHSKLLTAKITPGSTNAGAALRQQFDTRLKDDLRPAIDNMRKTLLDAGRRMIIIAQQYQKTEDINNDTAERLRDLVNSLKNTYSGIESTLPPPPGGLPNMTPPSTPPKSEPKK